MAVVMQKRRMSRMRLAAGLVLAMACAPLSRADLPASAVGPETFVVANVNLAKVDPANVEATVKAVMGASAPDLSKEMGEFKDKYKEFVDAGAESMAVIASGDPTGDKEPEGVAYVKMKAGADHAAIEAKAKEEQAKAAAKNGGKAEDMEIGWDGDYMVMHKKGTPMPSGGDAARMKMFQDAKSTGEPALDVVFVPTDKIRAKMKEQAAAGAAGGPPWAKEAGDAAVDAKSMSLGITLGDAPKIDVMVLAADEAGAKKLVDAATQAGQMMKGQAATIKQGGPQLAPMADAMTAIADALVAKQDGAKVSMSIDAKAVGPAVAQMIPMAMGLGGGAPPK